MINTVFDTITGKVSSNYCYDPFIHNRNRIFDDNIIYLEFKVDDNQLTIFNVNIDDKYRSKGILTKLLKMFEEHFSGIVFDTVINLRLKKFLKRRGYDTSKDNQKRLTNSK